MMKYFKIVGFIIPILFLSFKLYSQNKRVTIIPEPVSIKINTGTFSFSPSTMIIADSHLNNEARLLNVYLEKIYGFKLNTNPISKAGNANQIHLKLVTGNNNKEAYSLNILSNRIEISSSSAEGIFYGIQSLLQILPPQKWESSQVAAFLLPQLSIQDAPRFGYRGMHLDVARHFFDIDFIKKYIDYLSYYKFNTFHWHLTDDQGWRIEIKKYPLLTQVGGFRNGTIEGNYPGKGNTNKRYGGFYTQDQIREIVQYAAERHITIIPEIEMPGHASAAIAAYPQLSCFPDEDTKIPAKTVWAGSTKGKQVQQTWGVFEDIFAPTEYTFGFLEDVLDEVIELFPSKYIHIGGDEAPKDVWKRSEFCQNLIKEKNLKDEHGLQSYFIERMEKYLNSKGRNIIGWDEILEGGLAPNATVMSWRGVDGGVAAAQQKHNAIMTPTHYCYFDYAQTKNKDSITIGGFLPLDTVYTFDPIAKRLSIEQASYILGGQANLWTEYILYPTKVEYMIFPRITALSEVLWTPLEKKDYIRYRSRLPELYKRLDFWRTHYFKESNH